MIFVNFFELTIRCRAFQQQDVIAGWQELRRDANHYGSPSAARQIAAPQIRAIQRLQYRLIALVIAGSFETELQTQLAHGRRDGQAFRAVYISGQTGGKKERKKSYGGHRRVLSRARGLSLLLGKFLFQFFAFAAFRCQLLIQLVAARALFIGLLCLLRSLVFPLDARHFKLFDLGAQLDRLVKQPLPTEQQ